MEKEKIKVSGQKRVGQYQLGGRYVEVYLREGTGAEFIDRADDGCARIAVGCGTKCWQQFVGWVVHEAMEFAMYDLNVRWVPSLDYSADHAGYLFVMDHTQFSEAISRVGYFLADVLPDIARMYKKHCK